MAAFYCRIEDCTDPAERGELCALHRKRLQRTGSIGTKRLSDYAREPRDVLREAALSYADADDGDDLEFRQADDNLRKAAIGYVLRDVLTGRPPTVQTAIARATVNQEGSQAAAARVLGVSRFAVARALRRGSRPRARRG